jgi:Fe-S-cluster-containing hydrogenase component 2
MPNRVHMSTSCCEINCGGQADIAIVIQHTKPPKINHDLVANVCERPSVVARCPVAAIRPALVNGKPSLEVDEKKCICCGACYPPCPPMQINDPEHSKFAIWVGGKNSNARGKPTFMKMVASGIPNNPPRWPEVSAIVKKILYTYKEDARSVGAPVGLGRAHRLATLLREVRPALHQVPDRRLARLAGQPERLHIRHPLASDLKRGRGAVRQRPGRAGSEAWFDLGASCAVVGTKRSALVARQRRSVHAPGQRHGLELRQRGHCGRA